MSDENCRPITAHVLTGFLGSGKTTLLRRLLRDPAFSQTAVLVNEFGEVGLDHLLLEAVEGEIVLLENGCMCCTVRGDIKAAVIRLLERKRLGEVTGFDQLVIETTGLADPGPILATFATDRVLSHQLAIGAIVTVVDAVNGSANLERFDEAIKQAGVADRLVLTKTDLVDDETTERLVQRLMRLNPLASVIVAGPETAIDMGALFVSLSDPATRAREASSFFDIEPLEHRHGPVDSLALELHEPLDWAAFAVWLGMLLNRHGSEVLRVKGILDVIDSPTPVVVHGVQHTIHPPLHLTSWPGGQMQRRTRLVLIVKGLDTELVARSFHAFMKLGAGAERPAFA